MINHLPDIEYAVFILIPGTEFMFDLRELIFGLCVCGFATVISVGWICFFFLLIPPFSIPNEM